MQTSKELERLHSPDYQSLDQLINKESLLHAFKSSSSYAELWLRLKYTYYIRVSCINVRRAHRRIGHAISRLKNKDHYFTELNILIYGNDLSMRTVSHEGFVEIYLYNPKDKARFNKIKYQ